MKLNSQQIKRQMMKLEKKIYHTKKKLTKRMRVKMKI